MEKESYTFFEIEMGQLFFSLCGDSTESLDRQSYWKDIQRLKRLAQDEMRGEPLKQS